MEKPGLSLPSVELPSNIHADEPTDVDKLDRQTFADAFAHLAVLCETPLVIGIHGTWGTGKSSFMKMIEKSLKSSNGNDAHTVWFDPWMHQFDDNPILAFAHILAAETGEHAKETLKKIFAVTGTTVLSGFIKQIAGVTAKDVKELGSLYEEERFQVQEARTKLREHFEELTNKIRANTGKKRLVFFIDDLDRCRPENALRLLEALKLYLNINDCVFFLGVDHTALKHVIKEAFQGVDQHEIDYLDKIVQLPFHIPPIDLEKGMKEYVDELVKAERLEPCKEMLIYCLGDNPRQVKRFINTLILNDILANEILKKEYHPKILAFVLLIQLLRHDLFRRLIPNYNLLQEMAATGGVKKETWEEDVKKFYDDNFATDERLRTLLSMVGNLPEKDILERYLYLTRSAGMIRELEAIRLDSTLKEHQEWLFSKGTSGKRADLKGADLIGIDFEKADLREADLREANLLMASLREANLLLVDLRRANLTEADLQGARLQKALLQEADLLGANLQDARLLTANLRGANLEGAMGLTVDQLAQASTLFEAKLPPREEEELREKHPHLFEPPKDEEPPEDE